MQVNKNFYLFAQVKFYFINWQIIQANIGRARPCTEPSSQSTREILDFIYKVKRFANEFAIHLKYVYNSDAVC
jgi:hypothetical protein